jgi:predicted TIM-barrel fold metal-dependent hydrolase
LVKTAKRAPHAKVELLHFPGQIRGDDLNHLKEFLALPNTVLDISRLEGNGAIARMLGSIQGLPSARVPADRIAFGSHAPFCPVETALLKLIESPLDASQLHAIMRDNARRLLPRA